MDLQPKVKEKNLIGEEKIRTDIDLKQVLGIILVICSNLIISLLQVHSNAQKIKFLGKYDQVHRYSSLLSPFRNGKHNTFYVKAL